MTILTAKLNNGKKLTKSELAYLAQKPKTKPVSDPTIRSRPAARNEDASLSHDAPSGILAL
jgi:hypothetical protein